MYIIPQIEITTGMVTSNNATNSVADYNAGTTYNTDDQVAYADRVWTSLTDSNTGNTPAAGSTYWVDSGATNRAAFYDEKVTSQTTRSTSLTVELELGSLFNSIVLFNLTGGSVTLEMDDELSVTQYTETKSLVDSDVIDFWDYCFSDPTYRKVAIFPDVPGFSGWNARITVTGSTAGIGFIVAGRSKYAGITMNGSGPRFKDYSKITIDEDFGDYTRVVRGYAVGANFVVGFDPEATDAFLTFLANNRGRIVAAYPGENMEKYGLTVVGFLGAFDPDLQHRGVVPVTIEVKAIT